MPNWLLPLLALIGLVGFLYFAFWKGLATKPDQNNRNTYEGPVDLGGPGDGHHG